VFYSNDRVDTGAGNLFDSTDLFGTILSTDWRQRTQSAAVFGHAEWPVAESLNLITGLRYTWDEKEFRGGTTDLNPLGTSCILAPDCNPGFSGPFALTSTDARISDTDLSGKIGLDYKPGDDWLLYGSVSKGVKSGGFFGGITFTDAALAPFDPEELIAYEVGFKGRLADDTLQLNGAVFYYDYQDIQTFIQVSSNGLTVLKLDNVDSAKIRGFDLDILWRPTPGLDLQAGLGYCDTELGAFSSATGPQPAGNELPNAPELTFNGAVAYEWPLSDAYLMSVAFDTSYNDSVFKEAVNFGYLAADDYWLAGARLALAATDRHWELAAWGRNLGNEEYIVDAFDNGVGNGIRLYGEPRTYGVTLTYRWNE
jgi:iron complex outermembrane receptor protein